MSLDSVRFYDDPKNITHVEMQERAQTLNEENRVAREEALLQAQLDSEATLVVEQ